MFANLLQLLIRRDPPGGDYERAFVREVRVRQPRPRHRAVERLLLGGWVLIALKSGLVWWACAHYAVPINPWWVIAPTIAMGLLVTAIYRWRN